MTKIETIGTCPKSKLSIEGTNGPLGVNTKSNIIVFCRCFISLANCFSCRMKCRIMRIVREFKFRMNVSYSPSNIHHNCRGD